MDAFSVRIQAMSESPSHEIGAVLLYQTEDGRTRVECRIEGERLWLTQAQIAELFETTPQNITLHLKAIYAEAELSKTATCKAYLQVRTEGGRKISRSLNHYSLDASPRRRPIYARADAAKPHMGMTNINGTRLTRGDASIAKNYLTETELDGLNRIVAAYLDFAELQAMRRTPMTMGGWISKLDDFLRLSEHEILGHAGRISHEMASQKANSEFDRYQQRLTAVASRAERDFEAAIKKLPSPPNNAPAKKAGEET
jgi:hypothetical protein